MFLFPQHRRACDAAQRLARARVKQACVPVLVLAGYLY
jgi:hypothetical protein